MKGEKHSTTSLKAQQAIATDKEFPAKLHIFLERATESHPECAGWRKDGRSLYIDESQPRLVDLLTEFFGYGDVVSLAGLLKNSGFKKLRTTKTEHSVWTHSSFCRGSKDFSDVWTHGNYVDSSALGSNRDMMGRVPRKSGTTVSPCDVFRPTSNSNDVSRVANTHEHSVPTPRFKVFQTVFARDTDGVMYEAVVRRRLFGQSQSKQVQMGLVASEQEANELLSKEEEPMWHYFVHYSKWNVNWDRWVSEANVYEPSDRVRAYADKLLSEHRALRAELTKKVKGKKGFQTVEGSEFLQRWRLKMAKVDEEMSPDLDKVSKSNKAEATEPSKPTKKLKKLEMWTKAAIGAEKKLRERSLTGKSKHANKLALPFALKKNLVDSWEVITQCHMVLSLPAPVTVRQALDEYLKSKSVLQGSREFQELPDSKSNEDSELERGTTGESNLKDAESNGLDHEWQEMAEGVALLFDEALPNRLLYREEYPQFNVLCDHPEYSMKRFSDIYGCEHLMRMFARLPEVIADELSESEARPIFAKVNDFVRYLHKNQGTLFTQAYRKLNDLEVKERGKLIKLEERKRKRRYDSTDNDTVAKKVNVGA